MKWYQHDCKSHSDEKTMEIICEFGMEGYGFYHLCLELIGEKIDGNLNPKITISDRVLRKKSTLSHRKLTKILLFFDQISVISSNFSEGFWELECRNLLKRLDNWVKRSVVTTEQLPLEKNKKENKKEKRSITKNSESVFFKRFWEFYPKKKAKPVALRAWEKAVKLRADLTEEHFTEMVVKAIENFKRTPEWLKDNGAFIPYPASWLNGQRWEDDLSAPKVGGQSDFQKKREEEERKKREEWEKEREENPEMPKEARAELDKFLGRKPKEVQ